jgi:hypothetical protein
MLTVAGQAVSALELVAFISGLLSVWLTQRMHIANWPKMPGWWSRASAPRSQRLARAVEEVDKLLATARTIGPAPHPAEEFP